MKPVEMIRDGFTNCKGNTTEEGDNEYLKHTKENRNRKNN